MGDEHQIFPSSDLEDDVISSSESDDEADHFQQPLSSIIPDADSSDPDPETTTTNIPSPSPVTLSTPLPPPPPPPSQQLLSSSSVTVALATPPPLSQRPIDDSRKLFQRLWTDQDEIELLQGFLDYTASRGATAAGHYHDTGPFYDQIKNKLQLEFNKNQLVEKLRRLKKKYRTNLAKINSGKDFVFKSPHDQATFEISSKIWYNLPANNTYRGFDDDDQNPNPNPNPNSGAITTTNSSYNPVTIAAVTPPRPLNSSYVVNHINLNSSSPGGGGGGGGSSAGGFDMMLTSFSGNGGGGLPKLCTRKRSRVANAGKTEEKFVKTEGHTNNSAANNNAVNVTPLNYVSNSNVGVSSPLQGLVEETVRNCLSPVLKDLVNSAVNVSGSSGFKGVEGLALNALPLNFSAGRNLEGGMNEKWRKQQILELEVYSKRLELVQDQIKLSLEELKSMES